MDLYNVRQMFRGMWPDRVMSETPESDLRIARVRQDALILVRKENRLNQYGPMFFYVSVKLLNTETSN